MSTSPAAAPYRVLARKYRPQSFADLIGQEAMVRTVSNAIATGRIAHAFERLGLTCPAREDLAWLEQALGMRCYPMVRRE